MSLLYVMSHYMYILTVISRGPSSYNVYVVVGLLQKENTKKENCLLCKIFALALGNMNVMPYYYLCMHTIFCPMWQSLSIYFVKKLLYLGCFDATTTLVCNAAARSLCLDRCFVHWFTTFTWKASQLWKIKQVFACNLRPFLSGSHFWSMIGRQNENFPWPVNGFDCFSPFMVVRVVLVCVCAL